MVLRIASVGLSLVFAVLTSVTAAGCCSEMGCLDSVGMPLEPPLTEDGAYRVEIDTGDERLECEVVRDRGCPDGIEVQMRRRVYEVEVGDATRQQVEELPGLELIRLVRKAPEEFTLHVFRDDVEVLRETVTPTYREYQPNGAACGGSCRAGSATVHTD